MTTATMDFDVPMALSDDDRDQLTRRSAFTDTLLPDPGLATPQAVVMAIERASGATTIPRSERALILSRASEILIDRKDALARLIVDEVGKPISLARLEVDRAATTLSVSASVARDLSGTYVALDGHPGGEGRIAICRHRPIGPVVAITPFNFPLNLVVHKIGPAVAAGCPVLLKPAPQCPLSALALAQVLFDAGLPLDHLTVLLGGPKELGDSLLKSPEIAAVTFTGSVPAGQAIKEGTPSAKVLLELGSTTPAIIDFSADIEAAAPALAASAFGFAGQTCVSTQRVYVHESVSDSFIESFLESTRKLGIGDPLDEDVMVGPVIDEASRSRIEAWVAEAISGGARQLAGGHVVAGAMEPVVLQDAPHESKVIQEEVFGPVVSIQVVPNFEEALNQAEATSFGLQAAIFTDDLNQAVRASEKLSFGSVLINESPSFRIDSMPYGGVKDSGNTKEGPAFTAAELSTDQLLVISSQENAE